ncbi:enoyl-CoA hydratase/isomerase family protein [Sphingobium terrigena]|uniref:Enoyl-CoA hydratase/isomerase family protein n=1 Tax=Sphingobium terrigena TaxID=2304063 RepID=A0A418YR55_9SPHN|nr:enoyl-CoA hydratase/isomerase family protein [Sphingobium terrigena]RJG54121.1 enoyl-CoA hydratase/isomerase family protein [Sphingobium terrigena]
MQNITMEVDGHGVALVTLDVPGKPINVISQSVQQDLDLFVERLRTDPEIRGTIVRSGKTGGLCAGADLGEMLDDIARWREAESQDDLRAAVAEAGGYSQRIRAIETCGKPVAVIVHGQALGGGLELALAGHYRVAVDDATLRLALPEASIGLMPGAGATQRLIRMIGINAALPYLLDGTPLTLSDALAGGVVHAAATDGPQALKTARQWILTSGDPVAPWDVKGFKLPGGGSHSPAAYQFFGPAMAARLAEADQSPGIGNILKAVYEGAQVPIDAGLRIETRYFFNTARSPDAKAKIDAFFARRSTRNKATA